MRKEFKMLAAAVVTAAVVGCTGDSAPTVESTAPAERTPSGTNTISNDMCQVAPPAVTEDDYVRGAADASVTIIEYADFQ